MNTSTASVSWVWAWWFRHPAKRPGQINAMGSAVNPETTLLESSNTAKTKPCTVNRMSITTVSTNNNSLLRCIHVASLGSHEASGVNSQNTKISFFTYIISITWWQQMTFQWPIDPCHCATAILKLLENTFERHLKCSIQIVLIHIHTYSDKCPHIRTCPHTHTRKDPFMYNYRQNYFAQSQTFQFLNHHPSHPDTNYCSSTPLGQHFQQNNPKILESFTAHLI